MSETINVMRHESVFNPADHTYPIHIIGAGATGSRVFAALVELGLKNISVYDPDMVESHNIANQIYNAEDIGKTKIEGCAEFLKRKLGITGSKKIPDSFHFYPLYITPAILANEDSVKGGIVFILTDTMQSRKDIFKALKNRCKNNESSAPILIIETRMGSTHGSIFTINPFDPEACKAWASTLVDDTDEDSIELSPCGTALSVGTTASLIANYAVWQMKHFLIDPLGLQPRVDLFFKPTLTITSQNIAA